MSKVFITGSADGLGRLTAEKLVADGHTVVLHARNDSRAADARRQVPGAANVLIADLADLDEVKRLAAQVNHLGTFDAVIHNAGVYSASDSQIFAVNSLAPYVLTALIKRPARLIYLSSGLHASGMLRETMPHGVTYADSKLHDLLLAKAIARLWPAVYSNAVDPGWVPTKMGGPNASDSLEGGYITQGWLAVSDDPAAAVTGKYFYHQQQTQSAPAADDVELQEQFLSLCRDISGVAIPPN